MIFTIWIFKSLLWSHESFPLKYMRCSWWQKKAAGAWVPLCVDLIRTFTINISLHNSERQIRKYACVLTSRGLQAQVCKPHWSRVFPHVTPGILCLVFELCACLLTFQDYKHIERWTSLIIFDLFLHIHSSQCHAGHGSTVVNEGCFSNMGKLRRSFLSVNLLY